MKLFKRRKKIRFFIHEQDAIIVIHFGTDIYRVDRVKCNPKCQGLLIKYGYARSIKLIDKKKERVAILYK